MFFWDSTLSTTEVCCCTGGLARRRDSESPFFCGSMRVTPERETPWSSSPSSRFTVSLLGLGDSFFDWYFFELYLSMSLGGTLIKGADGTEGAFSTVCSFASGESLALCRL